MEQLTLDGEAVRIRTGTEHDLWRWCHLANLAAFDVFGIRNTCIATSHALVAFLRSQGLDAEPFRAEVGIFPVERGAHGTVLGSRGDGTRRPAAEPGCWRGHLAVSCGQHVLDPTIDQGDVGGRCVQPAVFVKPERWDEGASYCWTEAGLQVRHSRYYRQVGWKSAPAARPGQWRDVLAMMQEIDAA